MAPPEIAPALAPEPTPWNLPFQLAAGGSQTSKPIWESGVGVATPTRRHRGRATLVVPIVPPPGRYSALSILLRAEIIWPARAAQLAASSWLTGLAAWLLAASAGSRTRTDPNVRRCLMRAPRFPRGELSSARRRGSSRRRGMQ